jgi:hypothetical protein
MSDWGLAVSVMEERKVSKSTMEGRNGSREVVEKYGTEMATGVYAKELELK